MGISFLSQHDMQRLAEQLMRHARAAHPWPATMSEAEKFDIALRELNEMAAAMLKKKYRHVQAEALDAIAVLVRIYEGD